MTVTASQQKPAKPAKLPADEELIARGEVGRADDPHDRFGVITRPLELIIPRL